MMNAYVEPITYRLPDAGRGVWRRLLDTSLPGSEHQERPVEERDKYVVQPRSIEPPGAAIGARRIASATMGRDRRGGPAGSPFFGTLPGPVVRLLSRGAVAT